MTVDYDELTKQVLNMQPEIKFAAVVNVKGEIVHGGHKENVEQLLTGDNSKMSIHYAIQKRDIYTNLAYKIGKEKSAITEFEKAIIISVPISSNELFLVRTDKGVDYLKIVDFIYSKLNPQKYIREEIKAIQEEIEELKNLKENIKPDKKTVVKKKPDKKTVVKKKPDKKTVVKKKPDKKTSNPKRKTIRRK